MNWTDNMLNELPTKGAYRLRGEAMTRIEVFSDAAFAFAVTMLVISVSAIPENYTELVYALKGVPAFAAGFAMIMVFWSAHRTWSKRFGLEDGLSTLLSLALIFLILVYVYPLKLITTTFFAWVSGGFLPSSFQLSSPEEMAGLFVVYGLGVFLLAGIQACLYLRVKALAQPLNLNVVELIGVRSEASIWGTHALVGAISALAAIVFPTSVAVYAGFIYLLLPILSPLLGLHYGRLKQVALNKETAEAKD